MQSEQRHEEIDTDTDIDIDTDTDIDIDIDNDKDIRDAQDCQPVISGTVESQLASLQRQTRYLNIINQFSIALMRLDSLPAVYNYVTEDVVAKLGFDDCVIYILNSQNQLLELVSAHGVKSQESAVMSLPLGKGIVGSCAQSNTLIMINDTSKDPRYIVDIHPALSEIAVPIVNDGKVIGVIDCEHEQRNAYGSEHQQILLTVAAILSTKMQNAQSLMALEASVSKLAYAENLQAALFCIASLKSSAQDIDTFYQEIHRIVNTLLTAKNFFIALYDEKSELLNFPYHCDQYGDVHPSQFFSRDMLKNSLTGWVFRHQKTLLADPQIIGEMEARGEVELMGHLSVSWLGIPFDSGEHVKGVVVVQSYDEQTIYSHKDQELLNFVSQQISHALERIFGEQKLQHQALHDALTGLPNRVLYMDRAIHAMNRIKRKNQGSVCIMYLDLDRFKNINDTLGHLVGDEFLVKVGKLLNKNIRECDTLARLGGDEFAILIEDLTTRKEAIEVAERIIESLKLPVEVGGQQLATSVSIGIAFSDKRHSAVDLIKHADTAMYKAKEKGRAMYCIFSEEMLEDKNFYMRLDLEIKNGLAEKQFVLFYQPIFTTADSNISGLEALVRWQHQEKGLLFPGEFIEYAEESNLIIDVDRYILAQAAQQMAKWQDRFAVDFYISVNVSGRSFGSADFVDFVMGLKAQHQLRDGVFAIEITERALIDNIAQAKNNLKCLRDQGIQIFLDDFGTGYSSLSYLHQFSLDCLKIDRSFITDMSGNSFDNPLVKMIIALAKTLNLKVVAEGIELPQQQNCLKTLECDYGQGYMFSKPVTAEEIEKRFLSGK